MANWNRRKSKFIIHVPSSMGRKFGWRPEAEGQGPGPAPARSYGLLTRLTGTHALTSGTVARNTRRRDVRTSGSIGLGTYVRSIHLNVLPKSTMRNLKKNVDGRNCLPGSTPDLRLRGPYCATRQFGRLLVGLILFGLLHFGRIQIFRPRDDRHFGHVHFGYAYISAPNISAKFIDISAPYTSASYISAPKSLRRFFSVLTTNFLHNTHDFTSCLLLRTERHIFATLTSF